MQKVSPVFLKDIKTSCPLDDGLSGFVIIATSHVSLHAWPCYGMVNIDVFSCEDFQTTTVGDFAMALFQTTQIEIHEVERALRSPRGMVQTLQPSEIETIAIRANVPTSFDMRTHALTGDTSRSLPLIHGTLFTTIASSVYGGYPAISLMNQTERTL